MISNKTVAILFLIVLNMQLVVSTTPKDTPEPSPSRESTPLVRKRRPVPKTVEMLVDATNNMNPVEIPKESTETMSTSQELSVSQSKSGPGFFETLMSRGRYDRVCYFAGRIGKLGKFLKQFCQAIETLDKYNEILSHLKRHNLVASFYVLGDIEVVKGAIIAESKVYDDDNYLDGGDLEAALPLALDNDNHDRVTELLDIRKGITAEGDEQRKQGLKTSFEWFVDDFLENLAPWKDGMALRRFLTLRGEELRSKHRDILDTLCKDLVNHLGDKLHLPKAESLLVDLIGQPSLLTTVVFAGVFLDSGDDEDRSAFFKYGWREIIQESLKMERLNGRWKLWRVMQAERPDQFRGKFPSTEEARIAACAHLPTKRELEIKWIRENAPGFLETVEPALLDIFPAVLIPIVIEYARPTWIDVPSAEP